MLEFGLFALLLLLGGSLIWHTFRTGISPVPTPPKVARTFARGLDEVIVNAETPPRHACELGCGWGSLLIPSAKRIPHLHWRAWERSPLPYAITRLRLMLQLGGKQRARIQCFRRDFLKADLRDADVILCYLFPGAMTALADKFLREGLPNGWLISHTFRLPGHEPWRTYQADDLYRTPVYIYRLGEPGPKQSI
ncbi:class I SAM-dependent methyltransferase [Acanthopleuribacter pedis]|uniref:Class I SAM-dependent methyltransferase n=1 Tax=Acanthopleuribacter pedis TaxID=442870 RepID=A0A8J7QMF5_9BACT|nr:class I SAM-dependent methyltransferase [Acanthopleuribacter pedis]MBO1320680.1 class I SAM-dependent methyltransferase [Acanthopleuribacter pedis]